MGLYDIHFKLNQIVYESQHNAIDFIGKHKLFNILINNPNYHKQIPTTSNLVLNYSRNDGLNSEQIQAVDCIIQGSNYPLPYLLYGPPGKIHLFDIHQLFVTNRNNFFQRYW